MKQEPSDPVERADERRQSIRDRDVHIDRDGTVHQREHGNMDASQVPKERTIRNRGPMCRSMTMSIRISNPRRGVSRLAATICRPSRRKRKAATKRDRAKAMQLYGPASPKAR